MLEKLSVIPVGGGVIGVVHQPPLIVGQPILHSEDHAAEGAGEDPHTLLADECVHGVELHETGDELLAHLQLSLGLGDARIGVVGSRLWNGEGVVDLPSQRRTQFGILSQQVVEDRGAGAGLADDDDGALDPLAGDRRIVVAPLGDLEAVAQRQDHVGGGDLHPDGGQISFCD